MTISKKRNGKLNIPFLLLGIAIGIIGGIIFGMTIQQMIFGAGLVHIAEAFSGEINVNFNETKFIEQSKKIFVPAITSVLNNSFMNDFSDCKPVPCDCWDEGCALYCMQCELNKIPNGK